MTDKVLFDGIMPNLAGQVVIVTGGGRGLGRAFAQALSQAGAAVAIVARSSDQLAETAATISGNGSTVIPIQADVSDPQVVRQMIARVESELGSVDLVINNAGVVTPLGPLWETDPDEWWRAVEINLRSTMLCSASALKGMVHRRRGRIINVASVGGISGRPNASAYCTSKTAIIRLTETLAGETAEYGISIFAIHPGNVRTDMMKYLSESVPGQRWVPGAKLVMSSGQDDPIEESVKLVLTLASGAADALSGCYISVNDDLSNLIQHSSDVKANNFRTLRIQGL